MYTHIQVHDIFFPRRGSKVPCSTAQRVRLGHLEECGGLRDGFVDKECEKKIPSWKKNASRFAWSWIYRNKLGWNVTLKEFLYNAPNGDTVLVPYIDPQDLLAFLLEHHPDVLVGGTSNPQEMALHLESIWNGYKLQNAEHLVFREHANSLQSTIPLFYHGDEGRGKRRGNTVVLSCESPIGIHTTLPSRKRGRDECHCKPPAALERKYGRTTRKISSRLRPPLRSQQTNMRGHSFLQHFCLCIIPSSWHHVYPDFLTEFLTHLAGLFRRLFYEGITVKSRHFCAAICGAKGDWKWYTKAAKLDRSFEHKGGVRNIMCCHECLAGQDNMPWEDFSEIPSWAPTRFSQRPWSTAPPLSLIPYIPNAPERQIKRDPFHLCKVGNFRDHAASCVCYMIHAGLFGAVGDFDLKLQAAHGAFQLYCRANGTSPSLRSFSRALLNYPRFES